MESLTAVRKLRLFFLSEKRLPTYEEMKDVFRFSSKSSCYDLINKLIKEGFLEKDQKGHLRPKNLSLPLPHLGTVRAGFPTPAEEPLGDTMSLDDYLVKHPEATYLLTVKGDSMDGAGICEGDIAIIERRGEPKSGDIVAACLDNECTLKYFHKDKTGIVLKAANPKYPHLRAKTQLTIEGILVGIMRKYSRR